MYNNTRTEFQKLDTMQQVTNSIKSDPMKQQMTHFQQNAFVRTMPIQNKPMVNYGLMKPDIQGSASKRNLSQITPTHKPVCNAPIQNMSYEMSSSKPYSATTSSVLQNFTKNRIHPSSVFRPAAQLPSNPHQGVDVPDFNRMGATYQLPIASAHYAQNDFTHPQSMFLIKSSDSSSDLASSYDPMTMNRSGYNSLSTSKLLEDNEEFEQRRFEEYNMQTRHSRSQLDNFYRDIEMFDDNSLDRRLSSTNYHSYDLEPIGLDRGLDKLSVTKSLPQRKSLLGLSDLNSQKEFVTGIQINSNLHHKEECRRSSRHSSKEELRLGQSNEHDSRKRKSEELRARGQKSRDHDSRDRKCRDRKSNDRRSGDRRSRDGKSNNRRSRNSRSRNRKSNDRQTESHALSGGNSRHEKIKDLHSRNHNSRESHTNKSTNTLQIQNVDFGLAAVQSSKNNLSNSSSTSKNNSNISSRKRSNSMREEKSMASGDAKKISNLISKATDAIKHLKSKTDINNSDRKPASIQNVDVGKKKKIRKKAPMRCPLLCDNLQAGTVKWHVFTHHLPLMLWEIHFAKHTNDVAYHCLVMHGLSTLLKMVSEAEKRPRVFEDLIVYVKREYNNRGSGTITPAYHTYMTNFCKHNKWPVPNVFSFLDNKSPALLLHWRSLLVILARLSSAQRAEFKTLGNDMMDKVYGIKNVIPPPTNEMQKLREKFDKLKQEREEGLQNPKQKREEEFQKQKQKREEELRKQKRKREEEFQKQKQKREEELRKQKRKKEEELRKQKQKREEELENQKQKRDLVLELVEIDSFVASDAEEEVNNMQGDMKEYVQVKQIKLMREEELLSEKKEVDHLDKKIEGKHAQQIKQIIDVIIIDGQDDEPKVDDKRTLTSMGTINVDEKQSETPICAENSMSDSTQNPDVNTGEKSMSDSTQNPDVDSRENSMSDSIQNPEMTAAEKSMPDSIQNAEVDDKTAHTPLEESIEDGQHSLTTVKDSDLDQIVKSKEEALQTDFDIGEPCCTYEWKDGLEGFDGLFDFEGICKRIWKHGLPSNTTCTPDHILKVDQQTKPRTEVDIIGGVVFYSNPEHYPSTFNFDKKWTIAVGLDSVHSQTLSFANFNTLKSFRDNPSVGAIGPIGIDRTVNKSLWKAQEDVFKSIIKDVVTLDKPVLLDLCGTDDYNSDVYALAIRWMQKDLNHLQAIYLHNFKGTDEDVECWLQAFPNTRFGFNAGCKHFDECQITALKAVPKENLMLETGSPHIDVYLGVTTTPAFIGDVAQIVADLRGNTIEDILRNIVHNAKGLYSDREPQNLFCC